MAERNICSRHGLSSTEAQHKARRIAFDPWQHAFSFRLGNASQQANRFSFLCHTSPCKGQRGNPIPSLFQARSQRLQAKGSQPKAESRFQGSARRKACRRQSRIVRRQASLINPPRKCKRNLAPPEENKGNDSLDAPSRKPLW